MRGSAVILTCVFAASRAMAAQPPPDGSPPVRLRQAVAEALRASPALNAPQDAMEVAQIQKKLASSRFGLKVKPNVTAETAPAGLGQRVIGIDVAKRLSFGSEITTTVNSYSYGTGATALHDAGYTIGIFQPLLRGAGAATTLELTNAGRSMVASERGMTEAKQQLIVAVAERFFAVVKQRRLAQTSERALGRAQTLTAASRARATIGLATQLDVLRADLLASQASAILASQREALASALEELNLTIGRAPGDPLDIADEDLSDDALVAQGFRMPDASPAAVDRFVGAALTSRPDVREARDRIGDAERTLSVSRWNLLPQVSLNANYTERGLGPSASAVFSQFMNGWRVGLSTNYALDRSDQVAAAGQATVSLRAAERAAVDTERRVEADVRRAYRAWTRTRETIDIQRRAVDLAEKQLRLAELRFERGLGGSFDVVDAENNLYQAQSALIGAEVERALAALALERAAGTLDTGRFEP